MTLPPDQKERWESYVSDSPEINSLSQLVRLAVEREVRETGDPSAGGGDSDVSERLSEVLDQHRQLNSRLQGIEARLGSIEQAVQGVPEISKLANDVFRELPTKEQINEYLSEGRGPFLYLEDEHRNIDLAYSGSLGDVAHLLGAEELKVQQAIDKTTDVRALARPAGRVERCGSPDGSERNDF